MDLPVSYWHSDGTYVYVGFFQKHQRKIQELKMTKEEFDKKYTPISHGTDPAQPTAPTHVGVLNMD